MKEIRPTTGKVLLALFNILGLLDGRSFLDLFSGSGQVAAEAVRRRAGEVYAVEADKKRFMEMSKRLPAEVKTLCMDVRRAVPRFVKNGKKFDIIFADPPYGIGWSRELPELIEKNAGILEWNGVLILEHSDREPAKEMDSVTWQSERRNYGGTVLSLYRRRSENDD